MVTLRRFVFVFGVVQVLIAAGCFFAATATDNPLAGFACVVAGAINGRSGVRNILEGVFGLPGEFGPAPQFPPRDP